MNFREVFEKYLLFPLPFSRECICQATALWMYGLKTDLETVVSEEVVMFLYFALVPDIFFFYLIPNPSPSRRRGNFYLFPPEVIIQFFVALNFVHRSFCEVEIPSDSVVGSEYSLFDPPDLLSDPHGEEIL